MGADVRRIPLPAPTDISSSSGAFGNTSDDLATDISRVTDRTSYSIPEDGSPVTISTKKVRTPGGHSRNESKDSQTSLLIEYFEASKTRDGVHARPSVRVRVTPSSSKRSRREGAGGDHIQITETGKNRKPSYTRRISLPQNSDEQLATSELSETSSGRPPVEVEVLQGSDLSQLRRDESPTRYIVPGSDISSMPADSMLDGSTPAIITPRGYSPIPEEQERPGTVDTVRTMDTLKAPTRERSRSLSKERITQAAMKKIQEQQSSSGGKKKKISTSTSRRSSGSSTREFVIDESASPKSRSRKRHDEESRLGSNLEASELSAMSDVSAGKYSTRSAVSSSSINNPKLLTAVEDAIKRLILPELNAVKEEQARQKNRMKFDDITRDSMAPVGSRENLRRVSKSSSSPHIAGKPGIVADDRGVIETAEAPRVRKSRRSSRGSEKSHETAIREESKHRKSSSEKKKLAAAAVAAGGLTAAALRHHDSLQSLSEEREEHEKRERRKKRSKSRSRSASISESVEEYQAQERERGGLGIPPMPLQQSSAVGTDITRDSILSADTDRTRSKSDLVSETQGKEIREISRESPRQVLSPAPTTPRRSAQELEPASPISLESVKSGSGKKAAAVAAAGVGAAALFARQRDKHNAGSPISLRDENEEIVQHDRVRSLKSGESLASDRKARQHRSKLSVESLENSPAISKQRSNGFSIEQGREYLPEDPYTPEQAQHGAEDSWFDREHETNERLRREYEEESQLSSERRHTMYTDGSYLEDSPDKSFDAARDIRGVGANPEFVHTPVAVESAVASLHEPSLLGSVQSSQKTDSIHDGFGPDGANSRGVENATFHDIHGASSKERWEFIRDQALANARQQAGTASPRQSDASYDERPIMGASALPMVEEPMPEIGHGYDDASEVDTNPSIIKGPLAGGEHGDRSHWPYDPTPAMANRNSSEPDHHIARDVALGVGAGAAGLGLGLAASRSRDSDKLKENGRPIQLPPRQPSVEDAWEDVQYETQTPEPVPNVDGTQQVGYASPGGGRGLDEGYMSAAVPGGEVTPDPYAARNFDNTGYDNASVEQYEEEGEDPFTTQKHLRHASGLSHGMASPLYDAAMGKGIDRIKDRDVVALMDHLTVRDAHRNARDTEMLVTLVRTAAEMRNQWEDMKKFMQDQDRLVMAHTDRAADRTAQRVLGGPRPQPGGPVPIRGPRHQTSDETDDSTTKKKNLFRRAFKSLSSKNNQDLTKIEGMLMTLLDEVEDLKSTQVLGGSQHAPVDGGNSRSNSTGLYDPLRTVEDRGYEPDGMAGTSSSPAHSGHASNPSSKYLSTMHSGYDGRRNSEGNRISTVLEGDEEEEDWMPQSAPAQSGHYSNNDGMSTPTQEVRRGHSVPLDSPTNGESRHLQNSYSAEETPRTDKSRKHKSGASSIFSAIPKISRWSKTTTASTRDPNSEPNSAKKDRPYSGMSHSGSNLALGEYDEYDLNEDDRLRSRTSFDSQARSESRQSRPHSPLIPSEVERKSIEDPKYQAHRNSLGLMHPQPRAGPTHRHQTYLEDQALGYENPPTPDGDTWGNTPSLALNRNLNRFSDSSAGQAPANLSPVYSKEEDDAYSAHSASEQAHNRVPHQHQQQTGAGAAPPRPPKIKDIDEGPLVPAKVPLDEHDELPSATLTGPPPVGFGYHSPYSNSGMHIASPLEPIEEVRYSLETDGHSYRDALTPSPRPTATMQSQARKITGPREMPRKGSPGGGHLVVPRKPVASEVIREKSEFGLLLSGL